MNWLKLARNLTLQVEPTNACNLDCKICMRRNFQRPVRFLPLDEFTKILASGNFGYVGLHGWGEPLLNQQLFDMVEYAESKGVSTNLTTNATLLEDNMDGILKSGLREIAFGVYEKELFTKVIPQIERLIQEKGRRNFDRPKTYLDITIYKDNLEQITELVGLAPELGIDAVILHRLFNVYGVDPSAKYITAEEERELFARLRRLAGSLKLELYLPHKHSYPCRIVNRSIFVTVEGKVSPCTYLPDVYLGDAMEQGVDKVMQSRVYKDFIKNMKNHPICSRCQW